MRSRGLELPASEMLELIEVCFAHHQAVLACLVQTR